MPPGHLNLPAGEPPFPPDSAFPHFPPFPPRQVSFGVYETEEEAARQYDRALILEKGRGAKTNFPLRGYEAEVQQYEFDLAAW